MQALRFISSLFLILFFLAENVQGQAKPILKNLSLGIDYGKLYTLATPGHKRYEGSLSIESGYNFSLIAEYGAVDRSAMEVYKNGKYDYEGSYYRLGLDFNYALAEKNTLSLGFRYAESSFSDYLTYSINSSLWPDYTDELSRSGLKAVWGELVLTSDSQLWDNFFLGFNFRYRRQLKFIEENVIPVYAIPGYGKARYNYIPAVNLFIKYKLPLYNKNK